MNISLIHICEKIKNADGAVIVGAGERGRELLAYLKENTTALVEAFFDNNEKAVGTEIEHIEIKKPYKMAGKKILYIVAVDSRTAREELCTQLKGLGIEADDIIRYCRWGNDYLSTLDEKYYEEILDLIHFDRIGRKINWQNPVTYNEKINWEKLYVKDERRTRLADKYKAREWVKEKIGEQYLTKLYGVWDDADDIDFDALPDSFVLKANHGSSWNIVVKDKSQIDRTEVCRQLNKWKEKNFAFSALELYYGGIVPKIICEEYLEGMAESVYDYNIYCFHGEPVYIWCIKGSHKPDCKASFYTKEWAKMPFSYGYPKDEDLAPRPEKLDEMLEISRILSEDFKHVRVDLYNLPDGRVLFGEMTFATWAGLRKFEPDEYDMVLGSMI